MVGALALLWPASNQGLSAHASTSSKACLRVMLAAAVWAMGSMAARAKNLRQNLRHGAKCSGVLLMCCDGVGFWTNAESYAAPEGNWASSPVKSTGYRGFELMNIVILENNIRQ